MYLVFFIFIGLVRGFENDVGRMSAYTVPESYVLSIVPDLERDNGSFTGQVDILIRVKTTTSVILLDSKDLVLTDVRVKDESTNGYVNVNSWDYIEDRDQVRILLDGYIFADRKYTVCIQFSGHLRHDGTGFFKTDYTFDSGKIK